MASTEEDRPLSMTTMAGLVRSVGLPVQRPGTTNVSLFDGSVRYVCVRYEACGADLSRGAGDDG